MKPCFALHCCSTNYVSLVTVQVLLQTQVGSRVADKKIIGVLDCTCTLDSPLPHQVRSSLYAHTSCRLARVDPSLDEKHMQLHNCISNRPRVRSPSSHRAGKSENSLGRLNAVQKTQFKKQRTEGGGASRSEWMRQFHFSGGQVCGCCTKGTELLLHCE